MAKPGHPRFKTAVSRVMGDLEYSTWVLRQGLWNFDPNEQQVLQEVGPGMFTDVVLQVLSGQTTSDLDLQSCHDLREPLLLGDVLLLRINGFGAGQKHGHSSKQEYGEVYVRRYFGNS